MYKTDKKEHIFPVRARKNFLSLCSSTSIDKYLGVKEAPEYCFGRSVKNNLSLQMTKINV